MVIFKLITLLLHGSTFRTSTIIFDKILKLLFDMQLILFLLLLEVFGVRCNLVLIIWDLVGDCHETPVFIQLYIPFVLGESSLIQTVIHL